MDQEVKEILDEIIAKQRAFCVFAKMYYNDDEKAKEFVKMLYEQSHVRYLRDNFGAELIEKIERCYHKQ